jgi:DNA-3-methyladenine glycosylase I
MNVASPQPLDDVSRCEWADVDPLMAHYHDHEWGVEPRSDNEYFEVLMLEVFQAGLSWRTILHRREGFRQAFAGFSIPVVANFTEYEVEQLLQNEAIIRHRGKIVASIHNARAFQVIQQHAGSFRDWLRAMPPDEKLIYNALKPHLKFFGPTTCISFLEAAGKIPAPHDPDCWRYQPDVSGERTST